MVLYGGMWLVFLPSSCSSFHNSTDGHGIRTINWHEASFRTLPTASIKEKTNKILSDFTRIFSRSLSLSRCVYIF